MENGAQENDLAAGGFQGGEGSEQPERIEGREVSRR